MTQKDQEEPFFITEEIEADMVAAGYVFEPPAHVSIVRLPEVLAGLTDAELAAWPAQLATEKVELRRKRP